MSDIASLIAALLGKTDKKYSDRESTNVGDQRNRLHKFWDVGTVAKIPLRGPDFRDFDTEFQPMGWKPPININGKNFGVNQYGSEDVEYELSKYLGLRK